MLYYGQIVIGPAGSGKSTYCYTMQEMAETLKRNILIVNLDPAAEHNKYKCDVDIQDLVTLDDVMEEMELGPNGALVYCMEYLMENRKWLQQQLANVGQDDYVIFDCPGQIQLFTHLNVFNDLIKLLQSYGFSLATVYLLDITFIGDSAKYLSGLLQALAAQIALQLPAFTVLSKCDLFPNKQKIKKYIDFPDLDEGDENQILGEIRNEKIKQLTKVIKQILDSNSLVTLRQLDLSDQDTIRDILLQVDNAIQYGQNIQPDDKMYDQAEDHLNN